MRGERSGGVDGGAPGGEGRPHRGGRRRRPKQERNGGHEPEKLSAIGAAVVAVGAVIALTAYAVGGEERPAPCLEGCAAADVTTPDPTRSEPSRGAHASESAKPTKSPSPSASPTATASGSPTVSPSPTTPSAAPSTPSRPSRPSHPSRDDDDDDDDEGLAATYHTSQTWGSGFIGTLTVVNRSRHSVSDWQLSAYFPGRRITSAWSDGGRVRSFFDGSRVGGYGSPLPPGGRISISFQAGGHAGAPTYCSLNGRSCSG